MALEVRRGEQGRIPFVVGDTPHRAEPADQADLFDGALVVKVHADECGSVRGVRPSAVDKAGGPHFAIGGVRVVCRADSVDWAFAGRDDAEVGRAARLDHLHRRLAVGALEGCCPPSGLVVT